MTPSATPAQVPVREIDTRRRLRELLNSNLEFHQESSNHSTHDFHAFPAKFPPQLPRTFAQVLTLPDECVLDPMMGSGTTLVEAAALNRRAIGFDIDPLAVLISTVKTTTIDAHRALHEGQDLASRAQDRVVRARDSLLRKLSDRFDCETRDFIDYWFTEETQIEIIALLDEIENVHDQNLKNFLQLCMSAIIITKSGGVSLAWDLAHTRPHKFRQGIPKTYKPAIPEFSKRVMRNVARFEDLGTNDHSPQIALGNAENLTLADASIDLLFTSPPYASNAIDYMRASKFSLIWLGYSIPDLTRLRSKYIGGENTREFAMEELPQTTERIVQRITAVKPKRGLALRRYYSEMTRVLREAHRVLKPDRTAVFVVGSANMGGIDSQAHTCLGEIGTTIGLDLVDIGVRRIDRNRRMLPVTMKRQNDSQIENRMHEEYVIGFHKPGAIPC